MPNCRGGWLLITSKFGFRPSGFRVAFMQFLKVSFSTTSQITQFCVFPVGKILWIQVSTTLYGTIWYRVCTQAINFTDSTLNLCLFVSRGKTATPLTLCLTSTTFLLLQKFCPAALFIANKRDSVILLHMDY